VNQSEFHPLKHSDLLNTPASSLKDATVANYNRSAYVSERLLYVALLTYLKHVQGNDNIIGWNELGDELHSAICEAIGDDAFVQWNETTSQT
jgi:hypothetical protein